MVMIVSREFVLIIALAKWLMSFSKGQIDRGIIRVPTLGGTILDQTLLTSWSNSGLPGAIIIVF